MITSWNHWWGYYISQTMVYKFIIILGLPYSSNYYVTCVLEACLSFSHFIGIRFKFIDKMYPMGCTVQLHACLQAGVVVNFCYHIWLGMQSLPEEERNFIPLFLFSDIPESLFMITQRSTPNFICPYIYFYRTWQHVQW